MFESQTIYISRSYEKIRLKFIKIVMEFITKIIDHIFYIFYKIIKVKVRKY